MTDTTDPLAVARATNQRLNQEKQRLESELAAYRRAVAQWEIGEHRTYVPLRTLAVIAKAAGRDIETPQWLLHYQRVEQAEAAIDRVRILHDALDAETGLASPDDQITRGAAARKIAAALDGHTPPAPAAVPSAPAGRAALREQIAAAIAEQFTPDGKTTQGMRVSFQGPDGWPATRQPNPSEVADAVLAVLPEKQPRRGDAFEQWLKTQRDAAADYPEAHQAADGLLDLYRLHADTGTRLGEHVCEGRVAGDCECLEPAVGAQQPETRAIQCADAFWDGRPHAPHDWQQQPDAQPVRCPGVGEAQQPPGAQAQPPLHRWYVETRDGVADQWAPGTRFTDRAEAAERYEHVTANWPTWKDGTPVERRLVQETTSYTVLATHGVPHVGGNAEDCPACSGTNPDYPFICPGPNPAA